MEINKPSKILRTDLQESLNHHHINLQELSVFQRILLTTDGTVTNTLEAYLFEPIQVVKLSEKLTSVSQDVSFIQLKQGEEVIDRKILLRGKLSGRNFLYAESIIVTDRLDKKFREELLTTKNPIGKVWLDQKIETFKEIVDSGKEPANGLAEYFNIEREEKMIFRTYCVLSNRKYVMMITEKFPESYFLKDV